MPRPPRADEAGGLYHALNRGNARARIFRKEADYEAFERILAEGLERYEVQLYCFQLMPSHWHLVLRPNRDGEMSRFLRWITATHTMRYHAHYHTSGEGHVYQGRFKSFPIQDDGHFLAACRYVERYAQPMVDLLWTLVLFFGAETLLNRSEQTRPACASTNR